jgi:hypothetical protein
MDVSDASYYKQKPMKINENKGSQMGHTKKIFRKKHTKIVSSQVMRELKNDFKRM